MSARHTPGPWRAEDEKTGGFDIMGANGAWIATVHGSREEDEADARLFAAAPDMLAALERFAAAMRQRSYPQLQGVASDAFAAIAKARGEA